MGIKKNQNNYFSATKLILFSILKMSFSKANFDDKSIL